MNNKPTLLITAPYFPPHSGGLERYVYEITKRICKKGEWQVHVLTTSDTGNDKTETMQQGFTVHRLAHNFAVSNTPFSFRWFTQVRKILKDIKPDMVNVHMPVPGLGDLVVFLLSRHVPLVVTYHADSMHKGSFLPDILIWLYEHGPLRMLLRRANHIVCSSDTVRHGFLSRYLNKSSTITPAVDTDTFFPDESKKAESPTLLFVAGLNKGDKHKGLDELLHALVSVRTHVPGVQLVVVGEGNSRGEHEKTVKKLGLAGAVTFVGKLQGRELTEAYQKAHVFVLPTKNESFGMVIAEAMASGLPVVSSRVGGVPQLVVSDTTGVFIEPDDAGSIAKGILGFLQNPAHAEECGVAGREKIVRKYQWSERADKYARVFANVRNPKRCIAHVVGYHPPHVGGMEVVADEVARELAKRDYDIRVFTSNLGAKKAPHVEKDTHYTLRRLRSIDVAHTPIMWTLLFRLLVLPKGTLIHLHLAQALIPEIVLLVAKLRGFPVIAHFHLDVKPSGRLGWLFLLYKKHILCRVLRRVSAVMVFSQEQEDLVVRKHGVSRDKIHHIENAVGEIFFRERARTAPHTPLRVLTVSRLTIQKRADRLIEAMAFLKFPAELTIVGDGEDRAKLEALAKEQEGATIHFVGQKTHKEIGKYHEQADVFVIPSDREGGMPLTALEAMAAGLPVVGSNLVGIRELVLGVGMLVDDPSPETFAASLTLLHESGPDMFAQLSQQSKACAQKHTWPKATDGIERVYDTVQIYTKDA